MNANEWLATKVMKFKVKTVTKWKSEDDWTDTDYYVCSGVRIRVDKWDPPNNIEQALMCLDAYGNSALHCYKSSKSTIFICTINPVWNCEETAIVEWEAEADGNNRAQVIVNALLQATDYPGE